MEIMGLYGVLPGHCSGFYGHLTPADPPEHGAGKLPDGQFTRRQPTWFPNAAGRPPRTSESYRCEIEELVRSR